METGHINIIQAKGRAASVEAELVNGTIFLNKYDIAKLFNCFPQKVEANLRSIFKNRLLFESEVTYIHKYTYKGIERQCLYYNMDVLIFLSYRIGTVEARIFREFINDSFREHIKKKDKTKSYKIVWVTPPCYN